MGTWETFFLIRAIKFLFRWLSSNEKNRKPVIREEIEATVKILLEKYGDTDGD